MKIDLNKIQELEDQGYIRRQYHDTLDLQIINYTEKCQFKKHWDYLLLMCRGLIVDNTGLVIARPFDKFFNLGESYIPETTPETLQDLIIKHGHYDIFEKYDGSLGIVFFYNDEWHVATRGSFNSEQAIKAKEILHNFVEFNANLDYTHLFEIIFKENRIVVNYGDEEKLVYLTTRNPADGKYKADKWCIENLECAKQHNIMRDNVDNAEGYVLVFQDEYRVKVKFEEYKRLHRIMTGLNPKHIWECLKNGDDLDKLIENVPDEFYQWVKKVSNDLKRQFLKIKKQCQNDFTEIMNEFDTPIVRKDFALRAVKRQYSQILFMMLDNFEPDMKIWDLVKPKGEDYFKTEV